MRINLLELKQLATSSHSPVKKEGILSLRIREGKLWNKSDVLTDRFCRLIGNILFYFKGKHNTSEVVGVFILEGFKVNCNDSNSFEIEFEGGEKSAYFLANSPTEASDWIKTLQSCSYQDLKKKQKLLQQQLQDLKRNLRPVLELALRVNELTFLQGHDPSTFVQAQFINPGEEFWNPHPEQTEVSEALFMRTISFYDITTINADTKLKFVVFRVKGGSGKVEEIGSCFCVVGDVVRPQYEWTFDLQKDCEYAGTLTVLVVSFEDELLDGNRSMLSMDGPSFELPNNNHGSLKNNPVLQTTYNGEIITRTYKFPLEGEGEFIKGQEIMVGSCFTYHIPILFLKLLISEETELISALENLGSLEGNWEEVKKKKIEKTKFYLKKYQARLQHLLSVYQEPYLKKSVDKGVAELEFAPVNLQLQRLRVMTPNKRSSTNNEHDNNVTEHNDDITEVNYDITTVGATAAHAMGFKNGGLWQLLNHGSNAGGKSKRSSPKSQPITRCLQRSNQGHYLSEVKGYGHQVASVCGQLERLLAGEKNNSLSSNASKLLADLSGKTAKLNLLCDNRTVRDPVVAMAQVRRSPLGGSPLGGSPGGTSPAGDSSPENRWDELKLGLLSVFSDVVKSTTRISNPDLEHSFLFGKSMTHNDLRDATSDLERLRRSTEVVVNEVRSGVAFAQLKRSTNEEINYRRNVAFSQALSACVTAVTTAICSSIEDKLRLRQFLKVGVLFQVESLLSTYANELGMLHDYFVGVMDLQSVTFKLRPPNSRGGEKVSNLKISDPQLLPTLEGSPDALTVNLHLDETSFSLLPTELQNGGLIKLHPVLLNVGINEEQSLADRLGSSAVQEAINLESKSRLLRYHDKVRDNCPETLKEKLRHAGSFKVGVRGRDPSLMEVISRFSKVVEAKKNKNVEILELAADICRRLNGVRVTSCKSAKDRTSMAVTLEQARLLTNQHAVPQKVFTPALACFRSQGTRRENCLRNIGARKFTFTSVQLLTFPKLYKPPEGTYGKGDS